ncbi:MAG: formate transporter FocA [Chloroflexi bacterium RBG_13_51_18]|nr:MAG: formate transporter FocA [Chloroflexi bacterium RBG_13_51_18]
MVEPNNNNDYNSASTFDELLPADMASKAQEIGIKKAHLDFTSTFALAILAGAFIALGSIFFTVSQTTGGVEISWGLSRVIGGLAFSLGLVLILVGGAELFTGNNLIIMAWASRKLSTWRVVRNWGIVYLGNLCGAVATALVVFWGMHYEMAGGGVGQTALNIAQTKVELGFGQAIILGILCNAMVCMAVWLTYSARTVLGRVAAIIFPITGFVAAGFEHCVANMYFIPYAILIKAGAPDAFWQGIGTTAASYDNITWGTFFVNNLIPVTIGNMIGGVFFVALVYWVIYLRNKEANRL